MNLRSTIYWLLSMLLLVLCLTYSKPAPDSQTTEPIALTSYLDVEPSFFYYNNNQFHATVVGQLRLDIKAERIAADITQYNALIITDYHFKQNTEFSLNWQVKEQPYQLLFKQNRHSINPINFQTEDASEISDLHLLITSTQELGVKNNLQDEVLFNSIQLDQLHNQNQLAVNFSEWNDFTPVKLSSINGYTSSTDLHLKNLIFRLCCWLIVAVLLFLVFRIAGKHLLITLFLAWLISCSFYLNNHIRQHQQISQVFEPGQTIINRSDQEIHDLAELIIAKIQEPNSQYSSTDKLLLIGSNSFLKLRLKHHLQQFNIGMYINLRKLLLDPAASKFTYVLVGNQLRYCKQPSRYDWLNNQVNLIYVDAGFCLLRKK